MRKIRLIYIGFMVLTFIVSWISYDLYWSAPYDSTEEAVYDMVGDVTSMMVLTMLFGITFWVLIDDIVHLILERKERQETPRQIKFDAPARHRNEK